MLASSRVSIYKTETGCKAGDKCLFPHHKVDEQPKQKATERLLFPKEERATTRMLWLLWKLYHNWVASRKTRMHWFLREENSLGETRCKKSWDEVEKYGWLSLRYVKQVSRKRRDHRLEKYKSKILISEVPTLWHLRTGPMKRLKDNSDVPEARDGTLPKTFSSSKRTKLHSTCLRKNGYSRLRQQKSRRKESLQWILERVHIWSASETLTLLSWRPWGHRGVRRRWWRPTARCKQEKKPRYMSKNWTYSWQLCFLKKLPQFFLQGKLCEDHGFSHHWTSGQKPHLTKKVNRIDWNISNYLPFVVPELSTSSPTSSSSSSQDSVFDGSRYTKIQYPKEVELRVESFGETRCMNGEKPKTIIKMKDTKKYRAIYCMNCMIGYRNSERVWSMNVVSRHYHFFSWVTMESRAKVEPRSGKHSVFTHYLKDPNFDLCLKTKITRASCRRRAGTVVPRAESFGDLITADYKILSEESESRNNHRYAVVVRDLATQWLQSYPCKTKTFQETQNNLMECYCCLRNIQDL